MSRHIMGDETNTDGFPRVSGDEPFSTLPPISLRTFSPRERG